MISSSPFLGVLNIAQVTAPLTDCGREINVAVGTSLLTIIGLSILNVTKNVPMAQEIRVAALKITTACTQQPHLVSGKLNGYEVLMSYVIWYAQFPMFHVFKSLESSSF